MIKAKVKPKKKIGKVTGIRPPQPFNGRDPVTGQFVYGNETWNSRSSHGRKPIFETPEDLLSACDEYFGWAKNHPLYEHKAFAHMGVVTIEKVPKPRALTLGGLCLFLDIEKTTWHAYRSKPDFYLVTKQVDEAIREQKFAGAAANIFNANIIARDLGLVEKNELTGAGGGPIKTQNVHIDLSNMSIEGLDALEHALNVIEAATLVDKQTEDGVE